MFRYVPLLAICSGWFLTAIAVGQQRPNEAIPSTSQPTKEFIYKSTKQAELKLLVDVPDNWRRSDWRPAIVFFFGGGWTKGTPSQFENQARYLALRGMVAVRADYRVKSPHGVTPVACVEDAKSAMRWVRQHAAELGIDPDKIVAAGGSAGGHLAACTGTVTGFDAEGEETAISTRPVAMVLFNPVLNLTTHGLSKRLGDDQALAERISPTLQLSNKTPPALLMFGTEDKFLVQAEEYMARAKALGIKAELYTAKGQGHAFFNRSPWQERTLARSEQFLTSLGYLEGKSLLKPAADNE